MPKSIPDPSLWRTLTPLPRPLVPPPCPRAAPHILVLGAGVAGLTTAWILLDRGHHVTVVSEDWASTAERGGWNAADGGGRSGGACGGEKETRLSSQIAGALWEYPPAACGAQEADAVALGLGRRWAVGAYAVWDALAAFSSSSSSSSPSSSSPSSSSSSSADKEIGVRMMPATFFFQHRIEDDAAEARKMAQIVGSHTIRGFARHEGGEQLEALVQELGVEGGVFGVRDAYSFLAPVIDTDRAMAWLTRLVRAKGAVCVTERVGAGDLVDGAEEELRSRFAADVVVNAAGLGAGALAGDASCFPVRGALVRVRNQGSKRLERALIMRVDEGGEGVEPGIVYIVPRTEEVVVLGGLMQERVATLDLDVGAEAVRSMRARCEKFLPKLGEGGLDEGYPLAQGLRPFREKNVRVERELRRKKDGRWSPIVHSYGHGGSGWSLSFGCAGHAATLVEEILAGEPPQSMASYLENSGGKHNAETKL